MDYSGANLETDSNTTDPAALFDGDLNTRFMPLQWWQCK